MVRELIRLLTYGVASMVVMVEAQRASAQGMDCPIVDCDDSGVARGDAGGIFRGGYTMGFEMSDFVPTGSKCRWWLRGALETSLGCYDDSTRKRLVERSHYG